MITAGPWQEHRPSSGQRRRTTQRANPANVETALREAQKLRRVRAFGGRHRYTVSPLSFGSPGKERQPVSLRRDGQAFAIVPNWTVEPQLQLVHQRGSLTTPASLAVVQQTSHAGWLLCAGVRVKGEIATGAGLMQPCVRFNLYRSGSGTDITRVVGPIDARRHPGRASPCALPRKRPPCPASRVRRLRPDNGACPASSCSGARRW